jgi:3-hydroxyisobutyrate dehydrogenase-like beta-hydroxyacid dehydrogenase
MTTIAVLGLGEAGRLYARGLREAGAEVRGYDPHHELGDPAIRQCASLADALTGADVVLSLVGASAAASVARSALSAMSHNGIYADLNTGSPELKQYVESVAAAHGVLMADVAVLAPVLRAGHRTPLLASGPGANALVERLYALGVPIDVIEGEAGEAARRRLLRSVFMKGLAALMIEGVGVARTVGAEEWLRGQMAQELGPDGGALVERLIDGSYRHAVRREHEMQDALRAVESSGEPAEMTRATLAWFQRLAAEQRALPSAQD